MNISNVNIICLHFSKYAFRCSCFILPACFDEIILVWQITNSELLY